MIRITYYTISIQNSDPFCVFTVVVVALSSSITKSNKSLNYLRYTTNSEL